MSTEALPGYDRAAEWMKIMSKTTLRDSDVRREIRDSSDVLSEVELNTISGGKVRYGDLQIQKYLDKATV